MIKVSLISLGCAKNLVDSEIMVGHLHQAVEQEMLHLNDQEKSDRTTLAHLESGLIRAFVELQRV